MLFQAQRNRTLQSQPQNKPCPIFLQSSLLCLTCHKSRPPVDENSVFPKMVIILQTEHEGWNHEQIDHSKLGLTSTTQPLIDKLIFDDQLAAQTARERPILPWRDPLWGIGSTQQRRSTLDIALFNTTNYTIIRINTVESHHKNQALSWKWGRDSYTKNYGQKGNFHI